MATFGLKVEAPKLKEQKITAKKPREEPVTPSPKKRDATVLDQDIVQSSQKHHCGEAAWTSNADPNVKEGCVVEVRQAFRLTNKVAEANLLVGQKGIVKLI